MVLYDGFIRYKSVIEKNRSVVFHILECFLLVFFFNLQFQEWLIKDQI